MIKRVEHGFIKCSISVAPHQCELYKIPGRNFGKQANLKKKNQNKNTQTPVIKTIRLFPQYLCCQHGLLTFSQFSNIFAFEVEAIIMWSAFKKLSSEIWKFAGNRWVWTSIAVDRQSWSKSSSERPIWPRKCELKWVNICTLRRQSPVFTDFELLILISSHMWSDGPSFRANLSD